jgi:hypothetical protein
MSGQQCHGGMCRPAAAIALLDVIDDDKFLTVRLTVGTGHEHGEKLLKNVSVVFLSADPSIFNCCTDAPTFYRPRVIRLASQAAWQHKTKS